jgi:hypothetical protein
VSKVKTPIPKRIRIGQREYSVEVVEAMLEKCWQGCTDYGGKHIKVALKSNVSGKNFSDHEIQDTFWHEITHAILHDMGTPLYKSEKFVSGFSSRLASAIKSARF